MSIVQWLLLILVVAVVGGAYWYLRRQGDSDPWKGMDEPVDEPSSERGESLGGDSYIVGVRTLSSAAPEQRKAAQPPENEAEVTAQAGSAPERTSDTDIDASWTAFKTRAETAPPPEQRAAEPAAPPPEAAPPPRPARESQPEPEPRPAAARVENIKPRRAPAGEEEVFILHVASPDGRFFDGPDVHAALDAEGLKFGLNDVYHRVTDANGELESVYGVANMLKPGTLDPVEQDHLSTPGLTLFLILPGPIEGARGMRDMMETANAIAQRLKGEVLDDKRSLLKAQTAQYMLDQITELDRRARLRDAR